MSDRVRPAIVELTLTRIKEFVRESEAIFWVFGFPIILAVALGLAFRDKPPDPHRVGIVDGPAARRQAAVLAKSKMVVPVIVNAADGEADLRHGKVDLLLEGDHPILYRYDPTRPDSLSAKRIADDVLQSAAGRRDVLATRTQLAHEQGARYIDFLIPGLLGMNLMGTSMWGIGFTTVNARMKKLLKRLVATPMRKRDFLLSQFLSRLAFLVVEVVFVVAFGWIAFGVRVNGSILLLAFLCIMGAYAFSGLGLLAASRTRTIEGINGILNLVMMPMWLCSGVFFSYERFPTW